MMPPISHQLEDVEIATMTSTFISRKCFCLQDTLDRSHPIPKELDFGFSNPLKPDSRLALLP
jgi:hypothetical protein